MSDMLLLLANIAIVIGAISLLFVALRKRRLAIQSQEQVRWLEEQLQRALLQINSDKENEILAGFQTLAMIRDPGSRIKALPRIRELAQSENVNISKHARSTYDKIVDELAGDTNRKAR